MIVMEKAQLQIIINTSSPNEKKNWLIKAIAAAVRWKAYYPDNRDGDDENLAELSELLSELTDD